MATEIVLNTSWNGSIQGNRLTQSTVLNNAIAIPTLFGGTGMGAAPMDFLVASAACCYLMTMVGMLETQKIEISELTLHTETDAKSKNLIIHHFIEIKVPTEINEDKITIIEDTINKADRACHIGNMLKKADVEIHVQGTVIHP